MREHTIVTISRQYGSGGREVAEILAKKMQVRCYDRQIVYLAAEKIGNGDLDVESILEEAYKVPGSHSGFFGGLGIGSWTTPKGGYFISFESMDGCAKAIVAKAKEAGVVMTGAGATYPYGKDPKDSNIRIAPSFPPIDELAKAAEVFVVCVKLASVEKLLAE